MPFPSALIRRSRFFLVSSLRPPSRMREQLRAEAAAANTFLSYRDAQGRHIHEYPATGERYEMLPTMPPTRQLLAE